jgi:acetylornithine deacetylase/succinyl-diaminopimelate desuccinylase-like protein
VFNNGCAFGPGLVGKGSNCHDANEFWEEKDMKTAYEIYEKAIFALAKK